MQIAEEARLHFLKDIEFKLKKEASLRSKAEAKSNALKIKYKELLKGTFGNYSVDEVLGMIAIEATPKFTNEEENEREHSVYAYKRDQEIVDELTSLAINPEANEAAEEPLLTDVIHKDDNDLVDYEIDDV